MNKKCKPWLITGTVAVFAAISLVLSIYFSMLVNSTYKQGYWIAGEIFNAFAFVGIGALIGIYLYGKKFKHELYAALIAFLISLAVVLIIYLTPSSNGYLTRQLLEKLVPIMYVINGAGIVSIVKDAIPLIKKL